MTQAWVDLHDICGRITSYDRAEDWDNELRRIKAALDCANEGAEMLCILAALPSMNNHVRPW